MALFFEKEKAASLWLGSIRFACLWRGAEKIYTAVRSCFSGRLWRYNKAWQYKDNWNY